MKPFNYWKKLHESEHLEEFSLDRYGLLWLKTKSIIRKDILAEFLSQKNIHLENTKLNLQFPELYDKLIGDLESSHATLDQFIRDKNQEQLRNFRTKELVSELYKMKVFEWGGDRQNSLDKYLVSRYVKVIRSYDELLSKFDSEINEAVRGYVLNSWYNHWSSILIENIFKSHSYVMPTVGQIKHVDFFICDIPFDLKVTYLPSEYIKKRRSELGLQAELTFLKAKAREIGIDFDRNAKPDDIMYEISEKLKDKGTTKCEGVIRQLKNEKMRILNEVRQQPKTLAKWLYENQGEMRFGSENRLFLVLVDTEDFSGSWKLKRNIDLLSPSINNYLNDFSSKKVSDLKLNFKYSGKPQTFSTLTDVVFIVK